MTRSVTLRLGVLDASNFLEVILPNISEVSA